jgi:copper(I)-binding protein
LRSAATPDAARMVLLGGSRSAGLVIPAHGVLTVGLGGRRILLIGPKALRTGQNVPLTLDFPGTGRLVVEATVIR